MNRDELFEAAFAKHFGDKFYQEEGFIKTWTTSWERATEEQKADAARRGINTLEEYIAFGKSQDKIRIRGYAERLFIAIDRGDTDFLRSVLSNRANKMSKELFSQITGKDIRKANQKEIRAIVDSLDSL